MSPGAPRSGATSAGATRVGGGGAVALVATIALLAPILTAVPAHAELSVPPPSAVATIPAAELVPPGIDAASFVLVDAASGQVLLARAPDERRPVASAIKVLTALSAAERLPVQGSVTVGGEVDDVGGSEVGLAPGATWSVEDLLEALLVRSGNEAAEALAIAASGDRDAFITAMRRDAALLGVGDATITDPSGLADGNLLSARELATLARSALLHPVIAPIVARPTVVLPGLGEVPNRNLLVGSYRGATGVKTGFTSAAGNVIVASARRGERELLVVLLGSGPDPARFRDAGRLLDVGFEEMVAIDRLPAYELASGAGWWSATATPEPALVVPTGSEIELTVRAPALLDGRPPEGRLLVDGHEALRLDLALRRPVDDGGPRPGASAAARLAEGVADAVYAGLRAAVRSERLG